MCGIVGMIGHRDVTPILIDGLKHLEYRGYDSAGVATISDNSIKLLKRQGKVQELINGLKNFNTEGNIGIAHTRWATHGKPCERNAHPHVVQDRIAIVHNGIIENYQELKDKLKLSGDDLKSDTDSEVIAAYILFLVGQGQDLLTAVKNTVQELDGAYALCVLDVTEPDKIVVAKQGSPMAIGFGIDEYFVASDPLALQRVSQEFMYLEDGDVATIALTGVTVFDQNNTEVIREVHNRILDLEAVDKGNHRHFMQKEIFEQADAVRNTMSNRLSEDHVLESAFGRNAADIFAKVKSIQIIACGTSFYAGQIARGWLEELTGIPTQVEIASEFRYRKRAAAKDTLLVTISQSGETADTLQALKNAMQDTGFIASLAICNVPESSIVRDSDLVFLTHAGPEIGVASTKAFTTQLVALFMLTMVFAKKDTQINELIRQKIQHLQELPELITQFLKLDSAIADKAHYFKDKSHTLFLGRGVHYPVAREGALKLKEISYIHAEAYPAGELKHGPLALIDENMPVVVVCPNDSLLDKLKANIAEVVARGGQVIAVAPKSAKIKDTEQVHVLEVPEVDSVLTPILYTIPMQLLAYHVAVIKGTDVDKPRNLAKSVTVE